jgi:hypothetical protein
VSREGHFHVEAAIGIRRGYTCVTAILQLSDFAGLELSTFSSAFSLGFVLLYVFPSVFFKKLQQK